LLFTPTSPTEHDMFSGGSRWKRDDSVSSATLRKEGSFLNSLGLDPDGFDDPLKLGSVLGCYLGEIAGLDQQPFPFDIDDP